MHYTGPVRRISNQPLNAAIFLDRDGVLIEDVHLLTDPGDIRILEGVPQALRRFHEAGFRLIVISNQTVVARGLATRAGGLHDSCRNGASPGTGRWASPGWILFLPASPQCDTVGLSGCL